MPKSDKAEIPNPPPGEAAGPTFEEAYQQLEELVREMESDDLPLADLIDSYERGIRLHSLCQKRLEEAQGRIEIIRRRANGEIGLEPFDESSASADSEGVSPSSSLRNNAELF